MEIIYEDESLWAGQLGNLFVVLSFVAAALACFSFIKASSSEEKSWLKLGRQAFIVHSISVFGMIAVLFTMLVNQMYEYHYVWQHSNSEMPLRFIFSCFWEGQEGSFLLWTFWHVVLSFFLLGRIGRWEAPVLATISSVQVFLSSMLLGVYIFEYKLGSNPFSILLREHPDFAGLPLFRNPNYLENLDGRGLNPLLQNYWMTIHPPTLFLGFASTLIPFAFAIAGLVRKEFTDWMKPALPWAFFGVMVLGTGLLMGGAWAYEALSFGGFWAWDPVENASLVPWLTFVGAAHLMLIHKNKGSSLFGALFLTLISFLLILYSTFLTRSGILGDTSVHAFTDLGMSGQLLIYLLFYVGLSAWLLAVNYKKLPKTKTEESLWSREFWMFIGALTLLIAAFQISFTTSLPVINKVFGTKLASPVDPIDHYNSWQVPFAIVVGLVIGFGQFLRYKKTDAKKLFKDIFYALAGSLVSTFLIGMGLEMTNPFYVALLFASLFAVAGNLNYFIKVLKGKVKFAGASIAHMGFGLILLGALISTAKSTKISVNTSGIDITALGETMDNRENILLMKGDTLPMGNYHITYNGKLKEGKDVKFQVDFLKKTEDNKYSEAFSLQPFVQLNPRMGNVPEPDTKHFLTHDIYTHVTYAILEQKEENLKYEEKEDRQVKPGDTLFFENSIAYFDSITRIDDPSKIEGLENSDLAVQASFTVFDFNTKSYQLNTILALRDSSFTVTIPGKLEAAGLMLAFAKLNPDDGIVSLKVSERAQKKRDFIVMQAIVFPYINLLWMGCILLIIGTFIALYTRIKNTNWKKLNE